MNEIINGIQVIKMYGWEKNFAEVVQKVRGKEISAVKGSNYILALLYVLWAVSRVSLFLTLITYVYSGNVLTARKVFIVTAYYNILNMSMVHFWPLAITFCAEGYISTKRLKEFLLMPECKKQMITSGEKEKIDVDKRKRINNEITSNSVDAITFKNLSAAWTNVNDQSVFGLKSINYDFKHGKTYAIIGSVGKNRVLH
jgi:ATP-binding cassette, subfamily C (CFTR/MRP), member 4